MTRPRQARALPRSQLIHLYDPELFWWATGIEDTFITTPWPKTGRTLDEYELTGHYRRWKSDLDRIVDLGVGTARYGIPWPRINPKPNRWDWSFADKTLGYLLERGVDPIVDLVHYGTPSWMEGAYLNPDFPQRMGEYAERLAERFRGQIRWYTPLNEPRITAWYCGRLGWWPPFRKGWKGFVQVMLSICRGIVLVARAIRRVDRENVLVHVDATDLYSTADESLEGEVEQRQEIVFLALDLVSGRIVPGHPLWDWLLSHGAQDSDLDWFQEYRVDLDIVGLNLYPMFTRKVLVRSQRGLRIRMPYGTGELVGHLAEQYWKRYRRPLMITETAALGSVARRHRWLEASVSAVRAVRARGIPVVGYTWWPLFSLVAWAYRQGQRAVKEYLLRMGLWDLAPGDGLERDATPLVQAYREMVRGGCASVGRLEANLEGGRT